MKIVIGTNYFGTYHRQTIAQQSLLKLKRIFGDILKLIDFQFKDETDTHTPVDGFDTQFVLSRSSKDIPGATKKLPFVDEILAHLTLIDCDYFVFTNSDVIISDRLIYEILQNKIEARPYSRLDIQNINNLEDPLVPVRWEIAGFDTFVFRRDWLKQHGMLFHSYLMGKPYYDLAYASKMLIHGGGIIGNKNPAVCLHIHHGINAVTEECSEKEYNKDQYRLYDQDTSNILSHYIRKHLFTRKPNGQFLLVPPNEEAEEAAYFAQFKHE